MPGMVRVLWVPKIRPPMAPSQRDGRGRSGWRQDSITQVRLRPNRNSVAIKPMSNNYKSNYVFSVSSRDKLAPRPVPTGQARNMVQNAP